MLIYLYFIAGLGALLVAGGMLVRGAAALALHLRVSSVIIGMFIVGFGTSAPELIVCLDAALTGRPDLALGNIIGSNVANVLLVLGLCSLIYPLSVAPRTVYRDGLLLLLGTLVFVVISGNGLVGRIEGAMMVAALLLYSVYAAWVERAPEHPTREMHVHEAEAYVEDSYSLPKSILFLAVGLIGVMIGAALVVESGTAIARAWGAPEVVIGLTLVAVGTSLPELATGVMAAVRRRPDILIGNVLGSNLFNLLGILGTTAAVIPVPVPMRVLAVDVWVLTLVTAVFISMLIFGGRINRVAGGLFIAAYGTYMVVLFL